MHEPIRDAADSTGPAARASLQALVHGVALALMIGWILHIGSVVLVPMVLALMLSYVVFGVSRLMGAVPVVGPLIPAGLRHAIAAILICVGLFELLLLFTGNLAVFALRAPEFQSQLLATIRTAAAAVGFAGDISWETLQRDVIGQINVQALVRAGISSTAAMLGGLVFVLLNVAFMLIEQRSFRDKLDVISSDPARAARLHAVVTDINARVGRYLAVKTLINIVLGLVSYAIMLAVGLEFAALWAIAIAFLNYIPYLGSWLGVGLAVAMGIVQFGQFEPVLTLLIALSAIQFILGSFVEPMVMGSTLDLSPYAVLISLTVWASLWGVAGAIVAIPITAVLMIVLSEFEGARPIVVLLSRNGSLPAERKAG